MWIFLSDAFFSIVHKDCARDELLVRARREGDIEKVFGAAVKVARVGHADYLFRAVVPRAKVGQVLVAELNRVTYGNFKNNVQDDPLHNAYLQVWTAMAKVQPTAPYQGDLAGPDFEFLMPAPDHHETNAQLDARLARLRAAKRKRPAKLKKGL